MDGTMLALILAAGRGSRLAGLPDGVNKCALSIGETSPILHTVRAIRAVGDVRFLVVTGYAADSVRKALAPLRGSADITYVNNSLFAVHGCNYSLACAAAAGAFNGVKRLLIAEGDSLLPPETIHLLARAQDENAVLLRPSSFIIPSRSVIAIGRKGKVRRFAYDPEHENAFTVAALAPDEEVLGESMQLWTFSGGALADLTELLCRYAVAAERGGKPVLDSGVYSINKTGASLSPVFATAPEEWINLNTEQDRQKAEMCAWLST